MEEKAEPRGGLADFVLGSSCRHHARFQIWNTPLQNGIVPFIHRSIATIPSSSSPDYHDERALINSIAFHYKSHRLDDA